MKILLMAAVFLGFHAVGSETLPEIQSMTVSVVQENFNLAEVTHSLVLKDLGPAGWKSFEAKARGRFAEWSREFDDSDAKHFLDDKLLTLAPSVTSGKASSLREFCQWMALYDAFGEPLPHYIADISEKDKRWIATELSDFNWERSARRIKEKARQ